MPKNPKSTARRLAVLICIQTALSLVDQVKFHPTKQFTIDITDPALVAHAKKTHGDYYYFVGYWRKQKSSSEYLRESKHPANGGYLRSMIDTGTV